MEFFDVVDTQRAIRRFLPDPVPDSALRRVISAATRAPSARGAEPWYFVVVRDAERRATIAEHYRRAWDAGAAHTAATDADRDVAERSHYARMMAAAAELAQNLATAPVLVLCCLDRSQLGPIVGSGGTIRSPVAAYASIFPAVQNLLLAARALGLGTTLTTLHTGFEAALKTLLEIPPSIDVVTLVPLGYPRDRFGPTRRKPVAAVAFLDGWGVPLRLTDT